MTNLTKFKKNIDLSEELMNYMIANKLNVASNCSYVVFVKDNATLNKANSALVTDLLNEGRKVIKAEKTNDSDEPWTFKEVSS